MPTLPEGRTRVQSEMEERERILTFQCCNGPGHEPATDEPPAGGWRARHPVALDRFVLGVWDSASAFIHFVELFLTSSTRSPWEIVRPNTVRLPESDAVLPGWDRLPTLRTG